MEIVVGLVTATGVLTAAFLGAIFTRRTSERDWLREKRADAYLELLDLFTEINTTFAVGLKVSNLRTEAAVEHGHDFDGVEDAWHAQHRALEHLELRIELLGGKLGTVYRADANALIIDMLAALERDKITEPEWDAIVDRGRELIERLVSTARIDLGVKQAAGS